MSSQLEKKRRHSGESLENGNEEVKTLTSEVGSFPKTNMFSNFVVDKILGENAQNKIAFIHGHYEDKEDEAVVVLEKTPFNESTIQGVLTGESETMCSLQNDIYHTLDLVPLKQYSGIKTTLIYPATKKHIDKYTKQEVYLLQETCNDYSNITLPYLELEQFSAQWVYNILERKKEADRIVYEDDDKKDGFILLPDMKWDRKQLEDLYLVAIAHQHGIKSLRDLNTMHLPLLKNILKKGTVAIEEKFGVASSKLRIYLHYQPSYYHLHVHFTHLCYQAPGSGVERAHLLSDVIQNIELDGEYYVKKTMSFTAREGDKLFQLFKEKDRV